MMITVVQNDVTDCGNPVGKVVENNDSESVILKRDGAQVVECCNVVIQKEGERFYTQ